MSEPSLSSSESASLERGYRRLLACYPKWFRLQNEDEVLAVLMACAQDDQTRPARPGKHTVSACGTRPRWGRT